MNSQISLNDISPARITVAGLAAAAVWLLAPELAQAAITFGDIGQNVADSAKGVAKGITVVLPLDLAWACGAALTCTKPVKAKPASRGTMHPASLKSSLGRWLWASGNSSAPARPRCSVLIRPLVLMSLGCAKELS